MAPNGNRRPRGALEAEPGDRPGQCDRAVRKHRAERRLAGIDELDYQLLHDWSVGDIEGFWAAAAEFLGVRFHASPEATLVSRAMPGTKWFPGGTLNYAEHALRDGPGRAAEDLAVVFVREDGLRDWSATASYALSSAACARACNASA